MSETNKDTRSRKWLMTFNNPVEKDLTHEKLIEKIQELSSVIYWCMGDEVGSEGTFHTHVYVVLKNQIRRGTLDNKFAGGHFDKPNGTSEENRAYVFKDGEKFNKNPDTGKYEYTDSKGKLHTGIHDDDTNEEFGEVPQERQGGRTDISEIYNMVKEGLDNYEILENNPRFLLHVDKMDKARQIVKEKHFRKIRRDVKVTYIYGKTRTGKTSGVMDTFGYENVYRIVDYDHPFDHYEGEDVIIFDEFRDSIRLAKMLAYLEGYPLRLPARYMDRVACYTRVFIVTNIDIRDQYVEEKKYERESWDAFINRIENIVVYDGSNICDYPLKEYLKNGWNIHTCAALDKGGDTDEKV